MAHPHKYYDPEGPIKRLREICLALPETTEKEAWGECTFRVGGKMFAMTDNDHHDSGHVAVWVKAPPMVQETLAGSDPVRFFRPPYVGHKGALWLHARTSGVTAHGSMPERGINAIAKAARAVTKLDGFRFGVAPHAVLGAPTLNVGTISGGLNINSVPDAALIGIDIRTIPEQKHSALTERLTEYLGDEVTLTPAVDVEGVWTDPDVPWIREVFDIVTPVVGSRPDVRGAPYFTDASLLTPAYGGPPTVILGPGELPLAHQTDEYCVVDRLRHAVDVYVEIARRWCRL